MSLISLLIALAAERKLTAKWWQFKTYYQQYFAWFTNLVGKDRLCQNSIAIMLFIALPTLLVEFIVNSIDSGLLYLIVSTAILIVCFGCITSRDIYRKFLHAAFRGELTSCEHYQQQLAEDKSLTEEGIGQMLILLNYRYYIAIMLFFVLFGPAGAVFYRLLVTVVEKRGAHGAVLTETVSGGCSNILQIIDWLPVRITAFGYMFVGHFSKAFSTWVESIFDFEKSAQQVLIDVSKKAEDFMLDEDDCTVEPCLLVRLAKRNVLLFLAVLSVFTITGAIN